MTCLLGTQCSASRPDRTSTHAQAQRTAEAASAFTMQACPTAQDATNHTCPQALLLSWSSDSLCGSHTRGHCSSFQAATSLGRKLVLLFHWLGCCMVAHQHSCSALLQALLAAP